MHKAQEIGPLDWGAYIIRPSDPKYTRTSEAPHESGIYGWYSRDGDLMYIGRSRSIVNRLRQHQKQTFFWGGDPAFFSYRVVPERFMAGVEMAHIKTLEPPENTAREACSVPFWASLVAAIDEAWKDVLPIQKARLDAFYTQTAEQIARSL